MEFPEWMLPYMEQWAGFVEMRKAMKRVPFTDRAAKITINELAKLRDEGCDPGAVLDQSTQRGWRGVFRVEGANGNGTQPKTFDQLKNEGTDAALRRVFERSRASYPQIGPSSREATGRNADIDLFGGVTGHPDRKN